MKKKTKSRLSRNIRFRFFSSNFIKWHWGLFNIELYLHQKSIL